LSLPLKGFAINGSATMQDDVPDLKNVLGIAKETKFNWLK